MYFITKCILILNVRPLSEAGHGNARLRNTLWNYRLLRSNLEFRFSHRMLMPSRMVFTVNVKVLARYEYGPLFLAVSSICRTYIGSFTVRLFSRNKISPGTK